MKSALQDGTRDNHQERVIHHVVWFYPVCLRNKDNGQPLQFDLKL